MNNPQAQTSGTSQKWGRTEPAREGRGAASGARNTASLVGGWTPSRVSGLGMVAVILLAVVVLALATAVAAEGNPSEADAHFEASSGVGVLDADGPGMEATSSIASDPATATSSWSIAGEGSALIIASEAAPAMIASSISVSAR